LDRHGIECDNTSVKNPQANAIHERLHQTVAGALRSISYTHTPRTHAEAANLVDAALATVACAARSALHGTMKMCPAFIVFNGDMLLDIPSIADFEVLRLRQQALIQRNLIKSNKGRVSHDYQPNNEVLKLTCRPHKLEPRGTCPFRIEKVHTNGAIAIRVKPFVTERLNIRRVRPHK